MFEVGGRHYLRGIGKGQKPFTMPVPHDVWPALSQHLGTRSGPLWTAQTGGPMNPKIMSGLVLPIAAHLYPLGARRDE